ncbi:hypothetical protein [Gemmobacter sp.]|uniref:hypothetical protein n=1 Tax=Gemmobacter sp. TaxID=1898957 RepID=UPI002AFE2507|nr:hypothetical protein [Gemmobacter sp.]
MHHPDTPRGPAQVVRLRPLRPAGPIPATGETSVILARACGRVAMAVRHMVATGAVQPTRQPGGAA